MKITYIILYLLCGVIFLLTIFGSNLTKPIFSSISERTLEASGFKKSYVQSVDDKIDELLYKSKQIELQIEKIKKFFSSEEIDEGKYQKEKSGMLEKSFYTPLIEMFNFVFRIGFVFAAFFILMFAVIFHVVYNSFELRKRVRRLEELVSINERRLQQY